MPANTFSKLLHFFPICILLFTCACIVSAQTSADLQNKIDQRNKDIQSLTAEIAQYQDQLNTISTQVTSLSSTVKSLDLSQKKLALDIQLTTNKIDAKNDEISELQKQIVGKENSIEDDHRLISSSLKLIDQIDAGSVPEILIGSKSVTSALDSLNELGTLQGNIVAKITDLRNAKADLEYNKQKTEIAKNDLLKLNQQLKDQRQVVLDTQSEKNQLLKETKQSESQYQILLAQKKKQRDAFEQEILKYEEQIKTIIDASKLPHTGSGVLSWPLDKVRITQYFGNTAFATANPQIYNGNGHTGVDFSASIGTPVKAALSGTVVQMGNTDTVSTCLSFGKWIMVRHANGLSTLYAHLSLPTVSIGEDVTTGQVIGYSGYSGYVDPPGPRGAHLHFGVYATQGVEFKRFPASSNCHGVLIPVAGLNAYLNPLSYL